QKWRKKQLRYGANIGSNFPMPLSGRARLTKIACSSPVTQKIFPRTNPACVFLIGVSAMLGMRCQCPISLRKHSNKTRDLITNPDPPWPIADRAALSFWPFITCHALDSRYNAPLQCLPPATLPGFSRTGVRPQPRTDLSAVASAEADH